MNRYLGHLRRSAREGGFGMVELIAAMTIMLVGIMAVFALFNAGVIQIKRAATRTTAAALADAEMERFRAILYERIGLDDDDVAAADSTYKADSAYRADTSPTTSLSGAISATDLTIPVTSATGFPTTAPYLIEVDAERIVVNGGAGTTSWSVRVVEERGWNGTTAASHAAGAGVTQKQRVDLPACVEPPTPPCTDRVPSKSVTGADGHPYRVDTYITWHTITNSNSPQSSGRLVKLVTIVVRDDAAPHKEWARLSSAFDESTGV